MTPPVKLASDLSRAAPPTDPDSAVWLRTQDLTVHFGDRSALRGVNARFGPAETISVLGPNGAGKSTLLRVLAGMLAPSHGSVSIAGRPLRRPDRRVVYVPQRSGVDWTFPVSVLDVVLMGQLRRRSRWLPLGRVDRAAALEALARVGMDHLAAVQIGQLSGGQQQRVFLARALLQDGEILLLDEPFNGVDLPTQDLLGELFAGLRARGGTVVYATHDLERAVRTSDRVMLVNGRLVAAGAPSIVMTATNLRATFGGQAILLPEDLTGAGGTDRSPGPPAIELVGSGR
jgi:manganese/zinc/iron transport system ATP- binding protein